MTFNQRPKIIFCPFILITPLLVMLLLSACSHEILRQPGKKQATADALNLLISKEYTINRDGSYDLRLHLQRQILTYKGKKDFADFKFTYNNSYQSVTINKAQTITPDGTVIAASEKESHDIQAPWTAGASIYSRCRQKIINLPSVTVGSTIEIEATLHSQLGFWASETFRLTNPIKQKIVSITIPEGMKLTVFRPPWIEPASIQPRPEGRMYRWEVKDVPAIIPEQMMPADENMGSCLLVSTFTDWRQVADWYHSRLKQAETNQSLTSKFVKQAKLDKSSVNELYESLMQRVTPHPIDFLETELKPQPPATTIAKGHGTPADLALAFYQLLKQQRISASLLFVNTNGIMLNEFSRSPSPGLLTNPVVRCQGRDYSFQRQELPPGFTGCEGQLALNLANGRLEPIITTFGNRRASRISLRTNGQGSIEGSLHTVLSGQPAIAIREQLRYLTPQEMQVTTSRILHTIDPLAVLNGPFTTTGIDTPGQPVTIDFNFTIPRELAFAGGSYFLNLPTPALPEEYTSCREQRRNPLLIDKDFTDEVELQLILPPGFTFKALPVAGSGQLANLSWKSISQVNKKRTLRWSRSIKLVRGVIHTGEAYRQFRQAAISLYQPESRMVMIRPPAP